MYLIFDGTSCEWWGLVYIVIKGKQWITKPMGNGLCLTRCEKRILYMGILKRRWRLVEKMAPRRNLVILFTSKREKNMKQWSGYNRAISFFLFLFLFFLYSFFWVVDHTKVYREFKQKVKENDYVYFGRSHHIWS